MDLFLFGSTGTVVEMGRLERLAFNAAFNELDLNLYWNVATYFKLNELSSSPESLMALVGDEWATGLAEEVLEYVCHVYIRTVGAGFWDGGYSAFDFLVSGMCTQDIS